MYRGNKLEILLDCKRDFLENINLSEAEKSVLDSMCSHMWELGLLRKYEKIDENALEELSHVELHKHKYHPDLHLGDTIPEYNLKREIFKAGYLAGRKEYL